MKKIVSVLLVLALATVSFAGGSRDSNESGDPRGTFEWYLCVANATLPGLDAVEAEIVKYVKEEVGIDVNVNWVDFGTHGQQMQLKMAGQEQIDLMFTSTWTNNFYTDVSKGAYKVLDIEMIKDVAPNVWEGVLPAEAWDCATIGGNLYAIPNTQIHARSNSVMYVNKYVEEANFDPSSVNELRDLEPLFEYVVENYPGVTPFMHTGASDVYGFYGNVLGYETFGTANPVGFKIGDASATAVNMFETPEMIEYFELMREWQEKGYIRPDAATLTEADLAVDIKSGKFAVRLSLNNPDTLGQNLPVWGFEATDTSAMSITPFNVAPFLGSGEVAKTMLAIGVNSEFEKEAYQIVDLLYNKEDPYLQNLISYGIEGTHWEWDPTGDYVVALNMADYWDSCGWAHGNLFDAYKNAPGQDDWYPIGPDTLNAATPSSLLGFSFDMSNVASEMTQLGSVCAEYTKTLFGGAARDVSGTISDFNRALDTAGIDKVLAEYQKQVDAFLASK